MPTPDELRTELDAAVREFSKELGKQDRGTGVRKPPTIEISTTKFERRSVDLDLDRGAGQALSFPGPPAPPPPDGPTGACCVGGVCSILTAFQCTTLGGTYMGDGTVCTPDPC